MEDCFIVIITTFSRKVKRDGNTRPLWQNTIYEACPEIKDRKVLNMYNIFNLQKRHCE
jgi:hypothetical protein